jgi:hypothetical protein
MSESAFPLAPQGEAAVAPVDEHEAEGNRRLLLLVGGVALLVLVVAGYFLFLRGGSSDNSASGVVPSHHVATHTTTGSTTKKPAAAAKSVPSTFQDVLSRDPFQPLYVPAPPPAAPADVAAAGATAGSTASSTATSTTTASSAGTPVTLVKVYSKSGKTFAQTRVGTTVYNSAVGQTFAGTFQLLSVNGKAATYVQGDEQFSLSEGQEVLK